MLIYSLILNVGLVMAVIYLTIENHVRGKYNKVLFLRAWFLELKLLTISSYASCSDEIRKEIDHALTHIKSL